MSTRRQRKASAGLASSTSASSSSGSGYNDPPVPPDPPEPPPPTPSSSSSSSTGEPTTPHLVSQCNFVRTAIKRLADVVAELHEDVIPNPAGTVVRNPLLNLEAEQHANLTLAYRHLEDARMRLGKVLQAAEGGTSVYDRDEKAMSATPPRQAVSADAAGQAEASVPFSMRDNTSGR